MAIGGQLGDASGEGGAVRIHIVESGGHLARGMLLTLAAVIRGEWSTLVVVRREFGRPSP